MAARAWLPRLLFGVVCGAAAALVVAVALAPWLDSGAASPRGWPRVVALFARDGTLRRTSLASALGLVVTACVFFRPAPNRP